MSEWFSSLDKAVQVAVISAAGVVFSGIIASLIAWLGFWITFRTSTAANREVINATKEIKAEEKSIAAASKQAEFRQQWIENLRRAVAHYLTTVVSIVDKIDDKLSAERYRESVLQAEYIELLLNMNEQNSKALVQNMRTLFEKAVKPPDDVDQEEVLASRGKVVEAAQKILKEEWDKLRTELKTRRNKEG